MADAEQTMMYSKSCKVGVETMVPIDGDLDHLSHDHKLTAKILRKRQEELARRSRLLNPRLRAGGVPHEVLATQIASKSGTAEVEKAEDHFYAQSAVLQDQILQTVEGMKAARARERQMDVVDFSLTHLRKEQRREYDLSDPYAIKKDTLPDPDDPSLGPSSMLKFSSIGAETPEEKHQRQQAQAAWLREQMQEKKDRENDEKEFDRRYDERAILASHVRAVCEDTEREEQRQEKIAEASENLQLAQMVRQRNQAKKANDTALKDRHVDTVKNSDWIAEAHDWKIGATGKLIRTEYRRLSLEEEQDVYNSNARALLDKREKKKAVAQDEADEAAKVNFSVAVLGSLEEERFKQQQERRMRIVEANKQLAVAKKEADKGLRAEYMRYDP